MTRELFLLLVGVALLLVAVGLGLLADSIFKKDCDSGFVPICLVGVALSLLMACVLIVGSIDGYARSLHRLSEKVTE